MKLTLGLAALSSLFTIASSYGAEAKQPNILFIFSDDHALNSISAYGGPLATVAPTPNIDRIAAEGAIFKDSFCANSICGPSRACILSGKHSHKNGFLRNDGRGFDQSQWTFIKQIKKAGYQSAVIGKWHLKTNPTGFDYWDIFPDQGSYYNPVFMHMDGSKNKVEGYATDITTKKAITWLGQRDKEKPFILMCQHKAPHRTFSPALRHLNAFDGVEIPEPASLFDNYDTRSKTLAMNEMEIDRHMTWGYDLKLRKEEQGDAKLPSWRRYGAKEYNRMTAEQKKVWDAHFAPHNKAFLKDFNAGKLSAKDVVKWKYQRYIKNYLATVKSVDESVGSLMKYLEDNDLVDNTIVIYSSDQGFFLGEHRWFDKRWMFEESFKMPFLIKWPGVVKPGSKPEAMIQNIDYAPTFLEMAGMKAPKEVQGRSFVPILKGEKEKIREAVYYAYYELGEHRVPQHFGVRTKTHKLIHFPWTKEWNMFDLEKDPGEMVNIYDKPEAAEMQKHLHAEYDRLRKEFDAPTYNEFAPKGMKE